VNTKTYAAEVKALDDSEGSFEALVAVFGNVDLVGDRVMPGAFVKTIEEWRSRGAPVPVTWSHDWSIDGFIGQADPHDIAETDRGLVVKGRLDLADPRGLKAHRLLKDGLVRNFSFSYEVGDSRRAKDGANELTELELIEVGPTLVGANRATELLSVKAAIGSHHTATTDAAWDGPANWARLPSEPGPLRGATAWRDPEGDPAKKVSYKFIHHMVSADGAVGAANLTAASTGIGILNGGRGGANVPADDRRGIWSHLATHLRDGDMEPPELKAHDPAAKAGRILSAANEQRLRQGIAAIQDVLVQLDPTSTPEADDGKDEDPDEGKSEDQISPEQFAQQLEEALSLLP